MRIQHRGGQRNTAAFGNRRSGIGCYCWWIVDCSDIHIHCTHRLIGAATRAGIAIVVDDNGNGVCVIAVGVRGIVQILQVSGVVEVGVETGRRTRKGARRRCAANCHSTTRACRNLPATGGGECHRQRCRVCVDVGEVNR